MEQGRDRPCVGPGDPLGMGMGMGMCSPAVTSVVLCAVCGVCNLVAALVNLVAALVAVLAKCVSRIPRFGTQSRVTT